MNNQQRPTPECAANVFMARKVIDDEYHGFHDAIPLSLGEKLERERDEAREELENWKASGVHSCQDECKRPLCVANRKIKAMREAIKEAKHGIAYALLHHNIDPEAAVERLESTLAKLQPFINP